MGRLISVICLSSWVFLLTSPETQAKKRPWLEVEKLDFNWIDEDTSNGRMFVAMDSGIATKEDSIVSRLIQIAEWRRLNKGTGKPIKVAIFSDSAYAHPIRTFKKKDHKNWAEYFLAEYDTQKKEVWLHPALPGKKKKLVL